MAAVAALPCRHEHSDPRSRRRLDHQPDDVPLDRRWSRRQPDQPGTGRVPRAHRRRAGRLQRVHGDTGAAGLRQQPRQPHAQGAGGRREPVRHLHPKHRQLIGRADPLGGVRPRQPRVHPELAPAGGLGRPEPPADDGHRVGPADDRRGGHILPAQVRLRDRPRRRRRLADRGAERGALRHLLHLPDGPGGGDPRHDLALLHPRRPLPHRPGLGDRLHRDEHDRHPGAPSGGCGSQARFCQSKSPWNSRSAIGCQMASTSSISIEQGSPCQ